MNKWKTFCDKDAKWVIANYEIFCVPKSPSDTNGMKKIRDGKDLCLPSSVLHRSWESEEKNQKRDKLQLSINTQTRNRFFSSKHYWYFLNKCDSCTITFRLKVPYRKAFLVMLQVSFFDNDCSLVVLQCKCAKSSLVHEVFFFSTKFEWAMVAWFQTGFQSIC